MDSTQIIQNLRRIIRQLNLESKRADKAYGLSIPQILSLNFMRSKPDGQCTQLELRQHLYLNSSTVTGIIYRLETKGLIARLPKSQDKRLTRLALTSKGSDLISSIPPLLEERLFERIRNMSDAGQKQVHEGIAILVDILEEEAD